MSYRAVYATALDRFKNLPHLNSNKEVEKDGYYEPNLYYNDGKWHVSWIDSSEGDVLVDFEGEYIEWAILYAYLWCKKNHLSNKSSWVR